MPEIKEIRAKLRLYNNRILQRREELGLSQQSLAVAANIPLSVYCAMETLRYVPVGKDGEWLGPSVRLANFHCVEPEELWPDSVREMGEVSVMSKLLSPSELRRLVSPPLESALPAPDEVLESRELEKASRKVLATLTPREEKVIRLRFGIGEKGEHTFEEIGEKYQVGRERIRQVEAHALRKLRHRSRAKHLIPFIPPYRREPVLSKIDNRCETCTRPLTATRFACPACKQAISQCDVCRDKQKAAGWWPLCRYRHWHRDLAHCPGQLEGVFRGKKLLPLDQVKPGYYLCLPNDRWEEIRTVRMVASSPEKDYWAVDIKTLTGAEVRLLRRAYQNGLSSPVAKKSDIQFKHPQKALRVEAAGD